MISEAAELRDVIGEDSRTPSGLCYVSDKNGGVAGESCERRRRGGNRGAGVKITWKTIAPLVVWLVLYLVPVPAGLNADQWHYFAIFAAVIAG